MSYYDTIDDDVKRAKEILAVGRTNMEAFLDDTTGTPASRERTRQQVGAILYGADLYAAYKLLESFVEVIETITPGVVRQMLRAVEAGRAQHDQSPDK